MLFKKKEKLPPGYYDPADYVLVHKDHLAKLQRAFNAQSPATVDEPAPAIDAVGLQVEDSTDSPPA